MAATALLQPDNQRYLVRVQDSDVVLTPIKDAPSIRNFFLLETCQCFRFSKRLKKFVPFIATGTLSVRHGDNTQKIKDFTTKTRDQLLKEVRRYLTESKP